MAKFSLYNISLKNLPLGINTYSYELDKKYFDAIDGDEVKKGNVRVNLTVKKIASTFEFNFDIDGVIKVPCDRCLDEMDQVIDSQNRLFVKFGKEYSEESDEVVVIPEDEGDINIAWFIYEFIVLNIPVKHIHEQGKCNRAMSKKLQQHRALSPEDDEVIDATIEEDEADTEFEEDNTGLTDPRWDALKGINFEDNQ